MPEDPIVDRFSEGSFSKSGDERESHLECRRNGTSVLPVPRDSALSDGPILTKVGFDRIL